MYTRDQLRSIGFKRGDFEGREIYYKRFRDKQSPLIEIYEFEDGGWKKAYYGKSEYVERYIKDKEEENTNVFR